MTLPGNSYTTFDCDTHMHSFSLSYSLSVLLFVIRSGTLFDSDIPGIPFNFDTHSQSFRM